MSLDFIANSKVLASTCCFAGGYAVNSASIIVRQLAAKYLGLPIDPQNGLEYREFANNCVEAQRGIAYLHGIGLDRRLGVLLGTYTILAIREEISYRFPMPLETEITYQS